ncbi:MAG: hypothetical protein K6G24_11650 [Lachnospiraceae bacterium]|nr:hypothetical protein [Lachnospiraceae bacterium]
MAEEKNVKNEYDFLIQFLSEKYGGDIKAESLNAIYNENPDYAAKIRAMGRKSKELFGTTLAQYLKQIGIIGVRKKAETQKAEECDVETEPKSESKWIEEVKRRADEERRAEEKHIEEVKRRAEEERRAEAKRLEFERKVDEELRAEEERRAEAKRLEEERRAEEEQKAEAKRLAEEQRAEELRAEADRLEEEQRAEERRAEAKRIREEQQRAEEERLKEEARKAEEKRLEEARRAEAERLEEERRAEEERKAEEAFEAEIKKQRYELDHEFWVKERQRKLKERESEFARRMEERRLALEEEITTKHENYVKMRTELMMGYQKQLLSAEETLESLSILRFGQRKILNARIASAENRIDEIKADIEAETEEYQNELTEIEERVKLSEYDIRQEIEKDFPIPPEPVPPQTL